MRDMNSTSEHQPWKHREMIDGALIQLFKFWENGRPAFLNINTHGGQAWINFSGSLGFHSEHEQSRKFSTFQTKSSKSKTSQSPSKIKRNRIRAEAFRERKRREANNFSEKTNSSTQFQSATSSNLVADVSDIENPNELNKNSPSDIFHEQILETHDQQEKSTSTQQIEEATISCEMNSTEVTFNSELLVENHIQIQQDSSPASTQVIDDHSVLSFSNIEQNSNHKSSESSETNIVTTQGAGVEQNNGVTLSSPVTEETSESSFQSGDEDEIQTPKWLRDAISLRDYREKLTREAIALNKNMNKNI